MRISCQCGPCLFQNSDGKVPTDRREVIKKDLEGLTCLQVVEEGFDGDSRPAKDRCPTVDLWIDDDQFSVHGWTFGETNAQQCTAEEYC